MASLKGKVVFSLKNVIYLIIGDDMDFIYKFLDYLKFEKGFSDYTVKSYETDLKEFYDFAGDDEANIETVRNYLRKLYEDKYSSRSISRKVSSLSLSKVKGLLRII